MSDATHCAVRVMVLYEMFSDASRRPHQELAQTSGWSSHSDGILSLCLLRKPEAHVSGHARDLFSDGRFLRGISNVERRRRLIIGDPA
jgi:hypothetical protein